MLISDALELFLIEQQIKGNSERTIEIYTIYVNYLIEFLGDIDISNVTKQKIIDYQSNLLQRDTKPIASVPNYKPHKLSRFTVGSYVKHLRTFFRWLYNQNYIEEDIFNNYIFPKMPKVIKTIMSEEEIELVLLSFGNSMLGQRNKCIFLLLIDSGLRVQEVPALDITDIQFEQNRLLIRDSKGMKDRIVPISLYTKRELMKYLKFYRPVPYSIDEKAFLLNTDKTRLTDNSIKSMLFRLKKKLDLKKLNPHYLRHTFATRYLINGGDMSSLSLIMGHEDLDTTRKYVHLAQYYMKMDFDKYSSIAHIAAKSRKVK